MVKTYRELVVWQKAMDMVAEVYRLTKQLPREETYALGDQLRRAAVSVPSNIAEGFGRASRKEYAQFLGIANGSVCEVETQLFVGVRVGYFREDAIQPALGLLSEIGKMLHSIATKLVPSKTGP